MKILRLIDLDPEWLTKYDPSRGSWWRTDDSSVAQGILFACPSCAASRPDLVGVHSVVVFFSNCGIQVDPSRSLTKHLWSVSPPPSSGALRFENLTLSPSIDLTKDAEGNPKYPNEWHGFIQNGLIT